MKISKPINRIGVVGAGTMGSGIALAALFSGFEVVLQDPYPDALEAARAYIEKFLIKKEMLDRIIKLTLSDQLDDLSACNVVIEAALENLTIKSQIFQQLDEICPADSIFATNTSTLSVTAIASKTKAPARFAGMHFFNPAPLMPLVEIVRGRETSDDVIRVLFELARSLGKTPVETQDSPGFIVNRVARPYYGEALRILGEQVAGHFEIDLAMKYAAGFRMGPFELMDLIGIDINATAMQSMYDQTFGESRYRPHWLQMQQMASGHLGRKSGLGFYEYRDKYISQEISFPTESRTSGDVLIYSGEWENGIYELISSAGYRPVSAVDDSEDLKAVIITKRLTKAFAAELQSLFEYLIGNVPVFLTCLDATLESQLPVEVGLERFVGLDSLFFRDKSVVTLVKSHYLSEQVKDASEQFIESLGCTAIWIADSPGLIVPRVVCMLINEAAFAVLDGVAAPTKIDQAMRLGVNYPKGLIDWGCEIGWQRVLAVLAHLRYEYGEDRYRPCRLIHQWARRERRFGRKLSVQEL